MYFAYGSNMAEGVMREKCPQAELVGPARLDGYALAFRRRSVRSGTGVADVVASPNDFVWGVLWRIDADCVSTLDRKEGHPWAYTRVVVEVELEDGGRRTASTYVVTEPDGDHIQPSETYVADILEAARAHRLPDAYVTRLESELLSV
jgi:cation transport regulator ChaC